MLKLGKDAYKDSGGKDNLEKGDDNDISPMFVHSMDKMVMQGKFADLQMSILRTANDFLIRKSLVANLQIFLQGCSNAGK